MKQSLTWPDLFKLMKRDNAGRWYPDDSVVAEYLTDEEKEDLIK